MSGPRCTGYSKNSRKILVINHRQENVEITKNHLWNWMANKTFAISTVKTFAVYMI